MNCKLEKIIFDTGERQGLKLWVCFAVPCTGAVFGWVWPWVISQLISWAIR